MPRDAQIPLFLWVATAILAHLVFGGTAHQAALWVEDRIEMRRFVQGVRWFVRTSSDTIELSVDEEPPGRAADPEPAQEPNADLKPEQDADNESAEELPEVQADRKKEPDRAETEKTPEPNQETREELKAKLKEVEPIAPPQELVMKKAISVRQHVRDKQQPDNPDAEFLSEHSNKVMEQTQARITSNDQNEEQPTPGSSLSGAHDQPGNAHETRIAQSEDRPGEEGRAPSDEPAPDRPNPKERPNAGALEALAKVHAAPAQNGFASGKQKPPEQETSESTVKGSEARAEQHQEAGAPELLASEHGIDQTSKARTARIEQSGQRGRKKKELPRRKSRGFEDFLGLGASGTTASGINLNLTPGLAKDAIGLDQLSRERLADGARRRSQHLGSWKTVGIERWRSAIENYVPMVKPGNQTALNTARSPFGTYLSLIHNRLHPIFADWFLQSLNSLPAGHPMNRSDLSTNLEIVLDQDDGRVVKQGVTKTSGVTAFDIAALESVQRAAPFGTPPREIVSPDGHVYLHWEFHRDPRIACTTYNARPYILKVKPKPAPIPPVPPRDHPDERQGTRPTPSSIRLAQTP